MLSFVLFLLAYYNLEAQTIISLEGQISIPDHPTYHDDREVETSTTTIQRIVVGAARKASFCLWDMQFCDSENKKCDMRGRYYDEQSLSNYGFGTYRSCDDPHRQDISVGGIDWYGLHYDGQNLRLPSNTTNGLYFLKIEIDPFNFYEEADETNNVLILPIVFKFQQQENVKNTEGGH